MLKTVRDNASMIHASLLAKALAWVVLAHNDGKIARRIEKYLVSAHSVNGFQRNWFAMPG